MSRGKSKLSFELAEQIRREYFETDTTQKALAEKYGVGITSIRNILMNINYKTPN